MFTFILFFFVTEIHIAQVEIATSTYTNKKHLKLILISHQTTSNKLIQNAGVVKQNLKSTLL